jgi:hypothetical protein
LSEAKHPEESGEDGGAHNGLDSVPVELVTDLRPEVGDRPESDDAARDRFYQKTPIRLKSFWTFFFSGYQKNFIPKITDTFL